MFKIKNGFTLAEMMVVMLIMSIILAAMAPVMTTRNKADSSSPWRYSPENLSDAYFGAGESQIALIGQPNKLETDDAARLILTTSSSLPVHLSFKRDNTTLGRLQFVDTNLVLGSGNLDHLTTGGSNNISIGPNNLTQVTSGDSNIAIGDNALISTTSGRSNIGIGTTLAANVDGNNNVAVGDDALTKANSTWNVAIGKNAYELGTGGSNTIIGGDAMSEGSGSNNVAVGTNSLWYGSGDGNVAIGANSNYKNQSLTTFTNTTAVGFSSYASGNNSVSLGVSSTASNTDSIAIGNGTNASGETAIALGNLSNANDTDAIAIGNGVTADGESAIAIGSNEVTHTTQALADKALAIGDGAYATGEYSIALGVTTESLGTRNIAIGNNAIASNTDTIAIGVQSQTSGASSVAIGQYSKVNGGNYSAALGYSADASGHSAVAIGNNAKAVNNYNIAIGANACQYVTGTNKTCIGANSGPSDPVQRTDSSTESLYFGSAGSFARKDGRYNSTVNSIMELHKRGNYALAVVNADFVIRGDLITMPRKKSGGRDARYGGMRTKYIDNQIEFDNIGDPSDNFFSSDRRLKYVGKESTNGLEKIKQLKVFNYTFKKDENKTPHVGVIAQDLQKVFPDAVKKGTDGFLSIRFEDMFYAMINAIKELDTRISALEKENQELKARIERLEAKVK